MARRTAQVIVPAVQAEASMLVMVKAISLELAARRMAARTVVRSASLELPHMDIGMARHAAGVQLGIACMAIVACCLGVRSIQGELCPARMVKARYGPAFIGVALGAARGAEHAAVRIVMARPTVVQLLALVARRCGVTRSTIHSGMRAL